MDVSLLKQQSRWKERVDELKAMVDKLQPHYSGMKSWRMHWDMQLFKALEHQYQVTLHALHTELPQISCELEFKNRRVGLKPSLEELRAKFYGEIKKFIGIPTGFKGVGYYEEGGGGREKFKVLKIFKDMPDRNVPSLHIVYQKVSHPIYGRVGTRSISNRDTTLIRILPVAHRPSRRLPFTLPPPSPALSHPPRSPSLSLFPPSPALSLSPSSPATPSPVLPHAPANHLSFPSVQDASLTSPHFTQNNLSYPSPIPQPPTPSFASSYLTRPRSPSSLPSPALPALPHSPIPLPCLSLQSPCPPSSHPPGPILSPPPCTVSPFGRCCRRVISSGS